MTSSRRVYALLAVLMAVLFVSASLTLAGPEDPSVQNVQVPLTPQVRYPGIYLTGIYATSGGMADFVANLTKERLDEFGVEGVLLTTNWAYIEDQEPLVEGGANGHWTNMDTAFAWAGARSRVLGFLINTYSSARGIVGAMPTYLWDPTNAHYVPGAIVKTNLDGCEDDTGYHYDNPDCAFPRYWSDEYLTAYHRFVRELGRRYGDNPGLEFIAIGIGRDGENYPVDYSKPEVKQKFFEEIRNDLATKDLFCEDDPTPCTDPLTVWIAYVNDLVDVYHEAFPNKTILVQLAGSIFVTLDDKSTEKQRILDHANSLGVGQSVNNMYPNWLWAYMPKRTGFFDHLPFHGYDFAHTATKGNPAHNYPVAMEGYYKWVGCEKETGHSYGNIQVYWSLLSALSKHADYLRMYSDFFVEWNDEANQRGGPNWDKPRQDIIALINKWKPYLGRTPETAPGVFVALREHKGPWYQCQGRGPTNQRSSPGYPDYGNYSYWLYHNNTKTGGRTVPETAFPAIRTWYGAKGLVDWMGDPYAPYPYFNDDPYNQDLPQRKETWAIRRTDQETGNPFMFFNFDEQVRPLMNAADTITFTVTYVDMGTDTFSLWYQTETNGWRGKKATLTALYEVTPEDELRPISIPAGLTDVPKEGTKQIRQAVFAVNDASFSAGLREQADFYIWCNGDGDEWVHMVHVTRGPAPVVPTPTPWPTPTPTSTPTPLPSPSPTPTPTPTTATIIGKVYLDLNKNRHLDEGEPGMRGATVRLFSGSSQPVGTPVVTDETGQFVFTGLTPGFYRIVETDPPGYMSTTSNVYVGYLTAGAVKQDWNFGDYTNHIYITIVHSR